MDVKTVLLLSFLFVTGMIALGISLRFFRIASRERRQGLPFERKAGYAFAFLCLCTLFFLSGLFWTAYLINH